MCCVTERGKRKGITGLSLLILSEKNYDRKTFNKTGQKVEFKIDR